MSVKKNSAPGSYDKKSNAVKSILFVQCQSLNRNRYGPYNWNENLIMTAVAQKKHLTILVKTFLFNSLSRTKIVVGRLSNGNKA